MQVTQDLIPIFLVPGLNVNLKVTKKDTSSARSKLLETIHPGARPAIKIPIPCHFFSKGNIKIWHWQLGHATVETLRKLGFHGELDDCHIFHQGTHQALKKDILRSTASRASPGTIKPRTTKRKYCRTFYAKRESVMRLPKDTALDQMDWLRHSNLTIMEKFLCMLIDANVAPKLWPYAAYYECSYIIIFLILSSISTRVQMKIMETHPIFQPSKLLNKRDERSAK